MRKIYYLASCDTCRKIIKSLPSTANLEFHDIRQNPITIAELEFMHQLKNIMLTEDDYKKYILEHYTFLSRPVVILENEIFIGNSQPNILKLQKALSDE